MLTKNPPLDFFERACAAIDAPQTRVVSFDVFDTLLVRPVLEPVDLFHFIAGKAERAGLIAGFKGVRIQAEKDARIVMKMHDPLCEEPTLEAIYEALVERTGISKKQCDVLKKLELETEFDLMRARKPALELFRYALQKGKKVIAASDSYFSPEFIRQKLNNTGFEEVERLYVSSDIGRTKATGNLYQVILDDLAVEPQHIVHIGDNMNSDLKRPEALGMRAVHIPRPVYMFFTNTLCTDIWAAEDVILSRGYRLILGMIINEKFDTFHLKNWQYNSLFNGDPELFGYYGLGPAYLVQTMDEPILKGPFATSLLQALNPMDKEDLVDENPVLSLMRQGARQFIEDAKVLFKSNLNNLDLPKALAITPLVQMLKTPFAIDADMFNNTPFAKSLLSE